MEPIEHSSPDGSDIIITGSCYLNKCLHFHLCIGCSYQIETGTATFGESIEFFCIGAGDMSLCGITHFGEEYKLYIIHLTSSVNIWQSSRGIRSRDSGIRLRLSLHYIKNNTGIILDFTNFHFFKLYITG